MIREWFRTTTIQYYDPTWPDAFSKLAGRVKAALGSLVATIEHIASTAVPGLAAKPIIDPPHEPPHHLYVLSAGANELRLHLAFRDVLCADNALRDKYAALKRSLAKACKDDRSARSAKAYPRFRYAL
jgi:GrpB-like predicted nucleotidyltransferase (UPF0157 family)